MSGKLKAALQAVDWNKNSAFLCDDDAVSRRIENCNMRLAIWGRQLESIEAGTASLSFVREMQHAGHHAACCIALALYKPAAGAMRSALECALYHAYFRTHPSELSTLVRDDKYYVSKREILGFLNNHQFRFDELQKKLDLTGRLEKWYSKTSAVIHGQIPGVWSNGIQVSEFVHDKKIVEEVVKHFEEGTLIIQDLFLCSLAQEMWQNFSTTAKKFITAGMSGERKTTLKIDSA
ncbi:hypothetical protein LL967_12300 [Xanthomonas campestris pv. zinniae]|uniref:hypothetical protein n=1 Tax=Xanthomonas cannabis TaxID=1885674 RepID=UPI001E4CB500|nr:hypothetical protein [Xanthomonas campestris pv. zinniae]